MFDKIRNADGSLIMWKLSDFRSETRAATEDEKRVLWLRDDELVLELSRFWETRGKTLLSELCRLPYANCGLIEKLGDGDRTVENIALIKGMHISHKDEKMSLQPASEEMQHKLGVNPGATLICLERIVYGAQRPMEWRTAHCHMEGLQYQVSSSLILDQEASDPVFPQSGEAAWKLS